MWVARALERIDHEGKTSSPFVPSQVKYVKLYRYHFKMDVLRAIGCLIYGWLVEFTSRHLILLPFGLAI